MIANIEQILCGKWRGIVNTNAPSFCPNDITGIAFFSGTIIASLMPLFRPSDHARLFQTEMLNAQSTSGYPTNIGQKIGQAN